MHLQCCNLELQSCWQIDRDVTNGQKCSVQKWRGREVSHFWEKAAFEPFFTKCSQRIIFIYWSSFSKNSNMSCSCWGGSVLQRKYLLPGVFLRPQAFLQKGMSYLSVNTCLQTWGQSWWRWHMVVVDKSYFPETVYLPLLTCVKQ